MPRKLGLQSFNLRRPNIHLLSVAAVHGGLILVDSMRAGKRLPDALSKTVSIWCAVINRATRLRGPVERPSTSSDIAVAAADLDLDLDLRTPPGAVSPHEHAQIAARLDDWASALADSSYALHELARPLRPLWITPASSRFPYVAVTPDASPFLPVICASASRAVDAGTERRMGGFSYVQGSEDDHELWGQGLTPQVFWKHRAELLACSREELDAVVVKLVAAARETEQMAPAPGGEGLHAGAWSAPPTPVLKVGGRVLLCTLADMPRELEPSAGVSSTCEPPNDEETAFIVVRALSNVPHPVDADPAKERRSRDGEQTRAGANAASLGERSGDTSRVSHMHVPWENAGNMSSCTRSCRVVSFTISHLSLRQKICVAGEDEGHWRGAAQWFLMTKAVHY